MASDPDELGDARSREENRMYPGRAERLKSSNPVYAYAPRWIPTGNWRMSAFDLLLVALGAALILMVFSMRLFGVIG